MDLDFDSFEALLLKSLKLEFVAEVGVVDTEAEFNAGLVVVNANDDGALAANADTR